MRLRSHLIALVCAALVPVLGFAAFVGRENARLQLSVTERGMREIAHAVARTVDKELETAITTLEAVGEAERPDVALVDIGLPGFDGLEMARRVRHAVGASIHLVALTGYGQPDDRRLALEAGFDAHLVKPVDPPALLAAIRAVFSAAREA
jgi:CheY-like chemotaxis protein